MAQIGRILIIGGGIGGLATAAALQRVGFNAEVFEQADELREAGAGVGLWSNCMASLDQLGIGETLRRGSVAIRIVSVANALGRDLSRINLDDLGADFAAAACFVVLRPVLLAALAEKVAGESIHTSCRAVRIETAQDQVRLHLDNGKIEEGDLLVGADGLHSTTRSLVVGQDEIRYSGQTAFRGVARHPMAGPPVMREIQGAGQRAAVLPIDSETVFWWAALNAAPGKILSPSARRPFLLQCYKDWPFELESVIAASQSEAILQNDLEDRPPARRYFWGRVVLIGDAAHPTTPNLGQGANMAIDDAIVLARSLRDSASVPAALTRYQHERLRRTRQIVGRSWTYGRLCSWKSSASVAIREAMVRWVPNGLAKCLLRWQILDGVGPL